MMRRQNRMPGDRGVASLEFLGLAPLLLLIMMVVFQIGVAGWATTSAGNAARIGARAGTLAGYSTGNAEAEAKAAIPEQLRRNASVNVSCSGGNAGVCVARVSVPIPSFVPNWQFAPVVRVHEMPAIG